MSSEVVKRAVEKEAEAQLEAERGAKLKAERQAKREAEREREAYLKTMERDRQKLLVFLPALQETEWRRMLSLPVEFSARSPGPRQYIG